MDFITKLIRLPGPDICGLCNCQRETTSLKCRHRICEDCIEIQAMYSYIIPCFQCKGMCWNASTSQRGTKYTK